MPEHSLVCPAELAKAFAGGERRVWARHPATIDGICQPVAAETASEPESAWPGVIVDVSCGGIRVSLGRRFQPGTPLVIELPSESDEPSKYLQVRVVHVQPDDDGNWVHGCELRVQLAEDDLQAFV
jgi:hypothetical protein